MPDPSVDQEWKDGGVMRYGAYDPYGRQDPMAGEAPHQQVLVNLNKPTIADVVADLQEQLVVLGVAVDLPSHADGEECGISQLLMFVNAISDAEIEAIVLPWLGEGGV